MRTGRKDTQEDLLIYYSNMHTSIHYCLQFTLLPVAKIHPNKRGIDRAEYDSYKSGKYLRGGLCF